MRGNFLFDLIPYFIGLMFLAGIGMWIYQLSHSEQWADECKKGGGTVIRGQLNLYEGCVNGPNTGVVINKIQRP